jgi:hypothetical protein
VRVQQGDISNQQTVTVRLAAQRDTPVLQLTNEIQLPDGMKTTDAKPDAAAAAPEDSSRPKSTPIDASRSLWGFLIAIAVLGVVGVILYNVLRRRGVTAKSVLASAGIQLPDDEAASMQDQAVLAAAPAAAEPNTCPFCGGQKDSTGACPNCAIGATHAPSVPSGGERRLVAVSGPRAGSIFPLAAAVTIGRDPGRDIAVPDDSALSRNHAIVKPTALGTEIIDQGSSNGTFINGKRVADRTTLQPGDEITVGGSRFRYEA